MWGAHSLTEFVGNNHVFEREGFAPLVAALQRAGDGGNGTVAARTLRTVRNELHGIRGGDDVLLTFFSLAVPANVSVNVLCSEFVAFLFR